MGSSQADAPLLTALRAERIEAEPAVVQVWQRSHTKLPFKALAEVVKTTMRRLPCSGNASAV